MSRITKALEKLFQKHRIIFWYDEDNMLDHFESVEIPDVEKVKIENNEFGLKNRLIRQEPQQKFLVYKVGPEPKGTDNWLLDVQLAHTDFHTDKASLWLAELDLPYHFKPIVAQHEHFFKRAERRDRLKDKITKTDGTQEILLKMLGVCAGSELHLDGVLEALLSEYAQPDTKGNVPNPKFELIEKCKLTDTLWSHAKSAFGYESSVPGVKDFAIKLFKSCYYTEVSGKGDLKTEALVFLKRWKDSRPHGDAFEKVSDEFAGELSILADLESRNLKSVAETDYFRLIDRKVLSELADAVLNKTMTAGEVTQAVRSRRRGHWYRDYAHMYEAIEYAAKLTGLLDGLKIDLDSLEQGAKVYTETFYRIDQAYRKYIYHMQKASDATYFEKLNESLCGRYTNSFLMPLNDRWQELVDDADSWAIPNNYRQSTFFDRFVKRILDKNRKMYVIISDAMRFEVGEELSRRIRQEDRYESELSHLYTNLPSYTQLGMASLLPHKSLKIEADNKVSIDGQSSSGTANRDKILNAAIDGSALAIQADEFLRKKTEEVRSLVRDHEVIYIYHNRIDKTGHTRDTERQAFDAAEQSLDELVRIVKHLYSGTATNIILTADHGFLYQDEVVESDFSQATVTGEDTNTDRRFVTGRNLKTEGAVNLYSSESLGLEPGLQIAIPKSINRLRKSGSGTRFLHGGSTLQEVLVPVLQVKRHRKPDVSAVDVDVIPPTTSVISTGQVSVALYQSQPVSEKVHRRVLSIGIYASDGVLISNQEQVIFDLTSDHARERELKIRLVLSKLADDYNKEPVTLKLEELIKGTEEFKTYRSQQYTLRRSFTSDFD